MNHRVNGVTRSKEYSIFKKCIGRTLLTLCDSVVQEVVL